MGTQKKKRLNFFSTFKKLVKAKDLDKSKDWAKNEKLKKMEADKKAKDESASKIAPILTHKPQITSNMFFSYNKALGPPYRILLDTNFVNFSVQNKLDIMKAAMDCLYAKCEICITDCVIGELERLGEKFKVALRVAKDQRFTRLTCQHRGIYADDCICQRVEANPVYVVATCDKDLKRRLRKIPGVPIMYIKARKYSIERLPDADQMGAPRV